MNILKYILILYYIWKSRKYIQLNINNILINKKNRLYIKKNINNILMNNKILIY